jgi:serine/threonine protein kinase
VCCPLEGEELAVEKCPTCAEKVVPGSLFCDSCGATLTAVNVARKLRQASFTTIKDSKGGLLNAGERIAGRRKYLIEEAVAKSGFGATFRAQRINDEKQVLIKQMLEQSSYDQFKTQLMNSFKREAKFLKRVKHPAFPRGFEYFVRNKSFYLVMEFINGKELAKAVEEYRKTNGKVEDGLIVYLGIEIADALEVVHNHGYIYRDLKPQNIMLDGISSRVKMIDFGTLYHQSDADPLIFESEGYTPPEFLDKTKKFQASGDIYSLGALLYEVAVGETPELGKPKLDRRSRDGRLCSIIEKCLEVDPEKRYQRARHVKDELMKLTRKGLWPFRNKNAIAPIELSVLPKTLYPSTCTFCEYCGFSDPKSQAGYCKNCRVPLRVGRLILEEGKEKQKEFFLYADETIIGSASPSHFAIKDPQLSEGVKPQHLRIFRISTGLWLESLPKDGKSTALNSRKIIGPVELADGDTIQVSNLTFKFHLKDAC